jgi:hypothetical protein
MPSAACTVGGCASNDGASVSWSGKMGRGGAALLHRGGGMFQPAPALWGPGGLSQQVAAASQLQREEGMLKGFRGADAVHCPVRQHASQQVCRQGHGSGAKRARACKLPGRQCSQRRGGGAGAAQPSASRPAGPAQRQPRKNPKPANSGSPPSRPSRVAD